MGELIYVTCNRVFYILPNLKDSTCWFTLNLLFRLFLGKMRFNGTCSNYWKQDKRDVYSEVFFFLVSLSCFSSSSCFLHAFFVGPFNFLFVKVLEVKSNGTVSTRTINRRQILKSSGIEFYAWTWKVPCYLNGVWSC